MTKQRTRNLNERPIIFSAPMVRAILDGQKTVMRRIVKWPGWANSEDAGQQAALEHYRALAFYRDGRPIKILRCPFGAPGSQLWVREQFSYSYGTGVEDRSPCWYWADGQPDYGDWSRPAPSIYMPRWASRITLEIADIRVERLQDISEADCEREGVGHVMPYTARQMYEQLWNTINGPDSWAANPFVWVIEFKRAKT